VVVPQAPADPAVTGPTAARAGGSTGDSTGSTARAARFRTVLLAVLVALALVAAGVLAWLLLARGGDGEDVQASREEVMAQTEQFMLRMGTYGPDLLDDQGAMPEYRDRVKEVITDKFSASFDKEAGTAEQLVAQAGVTRVADVFATGVSSIDQDSARALVAGTFSDSYAVKGKTVDQEPIPFRIEVSLVKVDGEWLVDDFDPVSGDGPAPTEPDPGAPQ
jgi:Mce-associated membrane protein